METNDMTELLAVPDDDANRKIDPESRALVEYWRARAMEGSGDRAGETAARARQILLQLQRSLPEESRAPFAARPDISAVLAGPVR